MASVNGAVHREAARAVISPNVAVLVPAVAGLHRVALEGK